MLLVTGQRDGEERIDQKQRDQHAERAEKEQRGEAVVRPSADLAAGSKWQVAGDEQHVTRRSSPATLPPKEPRRQQLTCLTSLILSTYLIE